MIPARAPLLSTFPSVLSRAGALPGGSGSWRVWCSSLWENNPGCPKGPEQSSWSPLTHTSHVDFLVDHGAVISSHLPGAAGKGQPQHFGLSRGIQEELGHKGKPLAPYLCLPCPEMGLLAASLPVWLPQVWVGKDGKKGWEG